MNIQIYLIHNEWLKKWKQYVMLKDIKNGKKVKYSKDHLDQTYPGEITNYQLLKNFDEYLRDDDEKDITNFIIKEKSKEGIDYKLLPKECWDLLQEKYKDFEALPEKTKIYMSADMTFRDLKQKLVRILNKKANIQEESIDISEKNLRLWKHRKEYFNKQQIEDFFKKNEIHHKNLKIQQDENEDIEENAGIEFPGKQFEIFMDKTFDDLEYRDQITHKDDTLVVEQAAENGQFIFKYIKNLDLIGKCESCYHTKILKYPCICKKVSYCSEQCRTKDEDYHLSNCSAALEVSTSQLQFTKLPNAKMGVVGLYNLGNTCYMNTALQCLSNTYALTKYFLESHFIDEINEKNPLGTSGQLAKFYSLLLNELWYKDKDVFYPRLFKKVVGLNNMMFEGTQQNDTQEFLNFLLDSIHEDLNRVVNKPYVQLGESNNRPDEIVAKEYWDWHLKRNQSIIVDLMQGQYKSTLTCPQCNKISITFDPYMTVPLPIPQAFTCTYFFVPYIMEGQAQKEGDEEKSEGIFKSHFHVKTTDSLMNCKVIIADHASSYYKNDITPYDFIIALINKSDFTIAKLIEDDQQANLLNIEGKYLVFAYQLHPGCYSPQLTDVKEQYVNKYMKSNQMSDIEEAYEEIKQEETENENQKYQKINPQIYHNRSLVDSKWIKVPLLFNIIYKKKWCYSQEQNKDFIPKLIWLNLDFKMTDVYGHIFFSQISYIYNIEEPEQKQAELNKYLKLLEEYLKENNDFRDYQTCKLPFLLRIVNQKESSKYTYKKRKPCIICQSKYCDGCPLSINEDLRLGDFLKSLVNENKFDQNNLLYSESQQYTQSDSEEEEEEEKKSKTTSKNYFNSNEESETEILSQKNLDNKNRLKIFQLRITFLEKNEKLLPQDYDQRLLSFNGNHKIKQKEKLHKEIHLNECFEYFRKVEKLGQQNQWYCNTCKDHVSATKQIEIYSVPPILVICLQRFKSKNVYFKDKLEDKIIYPIDDLDMSPFVLNQDNQNQPLKYELYAVSNHYGSLAFGHYTANCKNPLTNKWYNYNDSHVTQIYSNYDSEIVSSAAYVLFYKRKDFPNDNIDYKALQIKPNSEGFQQSIQEMQDDHIPEPENTETDNNEEFVNIDIQNNGQEKLDKSMEELDKDD